VKVVYYYSKSSGVLIKFYTSFNCGNKRQKKFSWIWKWKHKNWKRFRVQSLPHLWPEYCSFSSY